LATAVKTPKKAPPPPPPKPPEDAAAIALRKRQIRLGTGLFFLLTGIFIIVSIVSYYFSWTTDQDKLRTAKSIWDFLLHDTSPIVNWGGRLGAAISDLLVYKGAGIASLTIGIAVTGLGMNLLYDKRVMPLLLYMRWVSILLILMAPILSYLFPHDLYNYPLGGNFGDRTIEYLNGLLGKAGTGMVLLSAVLFFVFVIIALDITPMLKRIRERAQKMAAIFNPPLKVNEEPEDNGLTEDEAEETQPSEPVPVAAPPAAVKAGPLKNALREAEGGEEQEDDEDTAQAASKQWNMTVVERAATPKNAVASTFNITPDDENPGLFLADEEATPTDETDEEVMPDDDAENAVRKASADDDEYNAEEEEPVKEEPIKAIKQPEFSYVIKQEEKSPVLRNGAHISIADNQPYAPEETLRNYKFPTLDLLENRVSDVVPMDKEELEGNKEQIIQTLRNFGIEIKTIKATVGPTVTLYEIVPAEGVRISKIKNLEDDIALALAALGIRIIAPIAGRGTIGIEVPNVNKQIVSMYTLISSDKFINNKMSLPIALGKKIDNENYIVDLATMPHLLVAGATGQGKSVGINAILVSLLYKKHPSTLKFVLIDPKKVELSTYRTIERHFLAKLPNEEDAIITDIKKVIYTLKALCDEMDDRYGLLKDAGCRNIKEYNEKFISRKLNPNEHKFLPFIVLVIDEFADLIMTAGKEVELPIARIAQLARAVGIHVIIATQRPSVNVITGTIKANFPARIAFKVSAKVDSRTILDQSGAEQLIGRGDMLISHGTDLLRLQCAFVDTPEVERIVDFIGNQQGYAQAHPLPEPEMDEEDGGAKTFDRKSKDKLFEECAKVVVQTQSGSTSMLQRRFNLGYNRAGRIMDQLEAAGIVGPSAGSKPREVLYVSESQLEQRLQELLKKGKGGDDDDY
jgi:DNA segregation ATPase FtsK/SpoIIIE, S-DNA-T family